MESKNGAKTEKRPPKILLILMFLFFSSVFVVSLYHVFSYFYQGAQQSNLNESMIEEGIETLEPNTTQAVLVPITLPSGITESVLVQTTPDISVDFSKLQKKYPKMVGWLYSQDKKYNHPIMQTRDNSYYVTHLPDGRVNHAGSLFLDCRDPSDFSAWNHVIYGHNMANGSMFGDLLEYQNRDYLSSIHIFFILQNKKPIDWKFSPHSLPQRNPLYTQDPILWKRNRNFCLMH